MHFAGVSLEMRIFGIRTELSPYLFICLAAALFILPLRWLVAMVTAAVVHEAGHLLALRLSKVAVEKLALDLLGARIIVKPLTLKQEFLCACAGPGAGLLLIGAGRLYPELAVCAFAQSLYNLIPIMPLDGGRIIRCALETLVSPQWSEKIMIMLEIVICAMMLYMGAVCLLNRLLFAACVLTAFVLLCAKRKIACKGESYAVQ